MPRRLAFIASCVAFLLLFVAPSVAETQFATADEAKALLDKAVAALKEDETKALGRTFTFGAPTPLTAS